MNTKNKCKSKSSCVDLSNMYDEQAIEIVVNKHLRNTVRKNWVTKKQKILYGE